MIEVELRSFISKETYEQLLSRLENEKYNIKETRQITYYFSGDKDFRLMTTKDNLKLWLKTGFIHDEARGEMTVIVDNEYKDQLLSMLTFLGYDIEIKWYRVRNEINYNNIDITIDYTHGYGYIIEAEIIVDDESKIEQSKDILKNLFNQFDIEVTDKQIFKDKYNDYKINWGEYTRDIDEDEFLLHN
jgi:adenylate cyclase class IV